MVYPANLSYRSESRVVLIGTSKCQDEKNLPPLPHVKENIRRLDQLFKDPQVIGLPPECVLKILDKEEASSIATAVARAASQATDTLLVYYAGHGLYGDESCPLYLAAGNTTSKTKYADALKINDLKQAMRRSTARNRFMLLDCCYSGRALDGGMGSLADEVKPAIDLGKGGTFSIAAVPGDHKALAPPGAAMTKFTEALVEVLEQGVPGVPDVFTFEDVYSHLRQRILSETDMAAPEFVGSNQGGRFRVAANCHGRPRLAKLPADFVFGRELIAILRSPAESIESKANSLALRIVHWEELRQANTEGIGTASLYMHPNTIPGESLQSQAYRLANANLREPIDIDRDSIIDAAVLQLPKGTRPDIFILRVELGRKTARREKMMAKARAIITSENEMIEKIFRG